MKMIGLSEAPSSCMHCVSTHQRLGDLQVILTARSASSCATKVWACWRILSDEVLPSRDVTFALYPNVRIRAFLTALGSKFSSPSQKTLDLVVQDLYGSPFKPCTATMLPIIFSCCTPKKLELFTLLLGSRPRGLRRLRNCPVEVGDRLAISIFGFCRGCGLP
jgi:hypothetical protein